MVKDISIHLSLESIHLGLERLEWARLLGNELIMFPMLEALTLNFRDWALDDKKGLKVSAALACGSFSFASV